VNTFEMLLEESVEVHGHLCPGQVLGVRMSLLGLRESGIADPKGKDRKNIMVFVETDRCAADAVQSVTGCSLGHRSMKFMDYGKMAATFLNLKTGKAVRVIAKEKSRRKAKEYFPGLENKYAAQLEAYKIMPEEDLFDVMEVTVKLNPDDMPGRPLRRVKCDICREYVQDSREVFSSGKILCRPCAGSGYYEQTGTKKGHRRVSCVCDLGGAEARESIIPEATVPGAPELPGVPSSARISVTDAVGTVLAHDITEIRPGEFKGRAFKKGHIIRKEDICHLQRLGKEHLFVLDIAADEMHEDDAAYALASALMGEGVKIMGEPKEGKITIIAGRDGLLKINKDALLELNMLGDVMCATLHDNTIVKEGQTVAGTRAIPLVVKRDIVKTAASIGARAGKIIEVREIRKPKAGVVITGNEVYYGRIKDAFAPIIRSKIKAVGGEIVGLYYAPDDESFIEARLRELINAGADLLITTGGMSVDPDDITRFAIRKLGAADICYGSAVLPGAMFLVAYISADAGKRESSEAMKSEGKEGNRSGEEYTDGGFRTSELPDFRTSQRIPILGIPACGMYGKTTIFDLILPRVLAGEKIGRKELAELGQGGLCMKCDPCRYPVCPFGK
jgi:formylmethanofuran dehydrogenase subunit E